GRSGAFSSVVRSFMRRSPVDWSRADKLAAAREFASTNAPQSSAFRVCSKITSDFGGSAAWPVARREVLPHGHQEHPRQWAVTDEQRSRWPGAAPPRRAGAVWLSGVVARSLQTPEGYARVVEAAFLRPQQLACVLATVGIALANRLRAELRTLLRHLGEVHRHDHRRHADRTAHGLHRVVLRSNRQRDPL